MKVREKNLKQRKRHSTYRKIDSERKVNYPKSYEVVSMESRLNGIKILK